MTYQIQTAENAVVMEGKQGVTLTSPEGGIVLLANGLKEEEDPTTNVKTKESLGYLIMESNNLALLKAGADNFVAIYEKNKNGETTGGMVDIHSNSKGAVNLSVHDSTGKALNTALTITDGKAHLGVFTAASTERLHVEKGLIKLASSVGAGPASKDLGKVEVTPAKVTIECMQSTMEVTVDGFDFKNAANTFEMHLNTDKFEVKGAKGVFMLQIDLKTNKCEIRGLQVMIESTIQTAITNLENKYQLNAIGTTETAIGELKKQVEALEKFQATIATNATQGISNQGNGVAIHSK